MKMLKWFKGGAFVGLLVSLSILLSCSIDTLGESITVDEQFEIDIEDMENYLMNKGIEDYDTLTITFDLSGSRITSELRVAILDFGDGESIEYGDVVRYNYAGKLMDDIIFDTSVASLAYQQDTTYTDSLVLELDDDDNFVLDDNGFPNADYASFEDGYYPIYTPGVPYTSSITTHTPSGWFIINEGGYVPGFSYGVNHILDRVNIGGKGIVLIPFLAGGAQFGATTSRPAFSSIYGPTAILFEITPVGKVD